MNNFQSEVAGRLVSRWFTIMCMHAKLVIMHTLTCFNGFTHRQIRDVSKCRYGDLSDDIPRQDRHLKLLHPQVQI